MTGLTEGNGGFKMTCQVTDGQKNLASFVKMVNEGNDIVLSKKGGYIKNNPPGKTIKLKLDQGTPQFGVWVKKANESSKDACAGVHSVDEDIKRSSASAFQRLEMSI